MKVIEERKAFEDGFERLQRIYKEWQRNPSKLVRDTLKKYLIECYDHLLVLDQIDYDAFKFEESIIMDRSSDRMRPINELLVPDDRESFVRKEEHIVAEIPKEIVVVPILEAKNEEQIAEKVISNSVEVDSLDNVVSKIEIVEEQLEKIIPREVKVVAEAGLKETEMLPIMEEKSAILEEKFTTKNEVKTAIIPENSYLSGVEEREIEDFFKNNFPPSDANNTQQHEKTVSAISQENDLVNAAAEMKKSVSEMSIVEESITGEEITAKEIIAEQVTAEEPIAIKEVEQDAIVEEEIKVAEMSEKVVGEVEEEIEEEPKNRWSSFFGKDEPKPFERSNGSLQLTLADKLSDTKKESGLHYEMKERAIADLNSAIPIAKKFEFIRELFADDSTNYKTAIASLNEAANIQIALDITENLADTYNWAAKGKLAEEFKVFLKRRFN